MPNKVADVMGTLNKMIEGDIAKIRAEQQGAYRGLELSLREREGDRAHELALKELDEKERARFKQETAELNGMVTAAEIKHSNSIYAQLESGIMDPIFLKKDGLSYDYTKANKKALIKKFKEAGFSNPESMARLFIMQSQGTTDSDGNKVESANNENIIQIAQNIATTLASDPSKINSFIDAGIFPEEEHGWVRLQQNLNQILTLRDTGLQLQEELMGLTRDDTKYDKDYHGIFWDMGMGQAPPGYQEGSASEGMAGTETGDKVDIVGKSGKPPKSTFKDYPDSGDYELNEIRYKLSKDKDSYPKYYTTLNSLVKDYSEFLTNDYVFMPTDHGMEEMGDDIRKIERQANKNVNAIWKNIELTQAQIKGLQDKLGSVRGGGGGGVLSSMKGLSQQDKDTIHKEIAVHYAKLDLLQRDYQHHKIFHGHARHDADKPENVRAIDFWKGEKAFNLLGFETARKEMDKYMYDGGAPANPLQGLLYGAAQVWSPQRWQEENIPAIKRGLSYLDMNQDRTFEFDVSDVPGSLFEVDLRNREEKEQALGKYLSKGLGWQENQLPKEWLETRNYNRRAASQFYSGHYDPLVYDQTAEDTAMESLEYLQNLPFRGTSILEMSDVLMPEDTNK